MSLREWYADLSAPARVVLVAGVAGVVLAGAVAVTVVGAAVVGTFVLGAGESADAGPPEASFTATRGDGTLTVTHAGGNSIAGERLLVVVDGEERTWAARTGDNWVVAGEAATVPVRDGVAVTVVYAADGERAVLARFEV